MPVRKNQTEPSLTYCSPETVLSVTAALPEGEVQLIKPEEPSSKSVYALKRWALLFLAFFGIYASSSMCPFCGTPGCPVGASGAALMGGIFATLWHYGKNIWESLRRVVSKRER